MKKVLIIFLCCVILLLSGCNQKTYVRISFDGEYAGETTRNGIDETTPVVNNAKETFPQSLPMYKMVERNISLEELKTMVQRLGLEDDPYFEDDDIVLNGNEVVCNLVSYTDFSRGYFDMTDEELEKLAWETFEKLPFMEGEFEYIGNYSKMTVTDKEGTHVSRVGVVFSRLLNGVRVIGEERCLLEFDGSGLVQIRISLFRYDEIGTMDLVTLENAESRIKTPDDFSLDTIREVDTLQVDRVKLLWVNQYSQGCTILQPIYNFIGTAFLDNDEQEEFSSIVIAIPETYTYEKE